MWFAWISQRLARSTIFACSRNASGIIFAFSAGRFFRLVLLITRSVCQDGAGLRQAGCKSQTRGPRRSVRRHFLSSNLNSRVLVRHREVDLDRSRAADLAIQLRAFGTRGPQGGLDLVNRKRDRTSELT